MDNIIKQLKNGAKHTKLSFSEKAAIRNMLLLHVKQNPYNKGIFENYLNPSPFSFEQWRTKKVTAGIVMVGLLLGGSVSFAAERALPGDVLFSVKTNVNEKVRGAIAVSPKAKAEWEVRLVERRIEEVKEIVQKENASPEKIELAEKYFDVYSKKVSRRIDELEKSENKVEAIVTAEQYSHMLLTHEDLGEDLERERKEKSKKYTASDNSVDDEPVFSTAMVSLESGSEDKDEESFKNVIREKRDEVEKKHKEMKERYDNEKNTEGDREKKSTRKEKVQRIQSENSQKQGIGDVREEIRSPREKNEGKSESEKRDND